jgi:hypothetical protein
VEALLCDAKRISRPCSGGSDVRTAKAPMSADVADDDGAALAG